MKASIIEACAIKAYAIEDSAQRKAAGYFYPAALRPNFLGVDYIIVVHR